MIELAQKKGVEVMFWSESTGWVAMIDLGDKTEWIKNTKKLSSMIKFLQKNNIKINN